MIIFPGEYGIGNEPGSIPNSDKQAWERLGACLQEIETVVHHTEIGNWTDEGGSDEA